MLERPAARWALVGVSVAVSLMVLVWWALQLGLVPFGDAAAPEAEAAAPGTVVPLGPGTYGLADPEGGSVRIEVALVVAEGTDPEAIAARRPVLDDALVAAVAQLSREDITGPGGAPRLRDAVLAAARKSYPDIEIQQALILEMIAG